MDSARRPRTRPGTIEPPAHAGAETSREALGALDVEGSIEAAHMRRLLALFRANGPSSRWLEGDRVELTHGELDVLLAWAHRHQARTDGKTTAARERARFRLIRFLLVFSHVRNRKDLENPVKLDRELVISAGLQRAQEIRDYRERVRRLGARLIGKVGSDKKVDDVFAFARWREGERAKTGPKPKD
jgi:hypothetical protein